MKKFYEGGEYFALSSFRITAVPVFTDDESLSRMAGTICEDSCYLSAGGNGESSIEVIRTAGTVRGGRIEHLLTVRTHDRSEQACAVRQETLVKGISSILHRTGYLFEEIPYGSYRSHLDGINADAVWSLKKQDILEYGVQGTYRSPAVIGRADWERIYSAMDGSGCTLEVHITPALLSEQERAAVMKNTANCTQAAEGMIPNLRDGLAAPSAERWKTYADEAYRPFAGVTILVAGTVTDAALVTARVRQAMEGASLSAEPAPDLRSVSIHNRPWRLAGRMRKRGATVFEKWSSGEASELLRLPAQGGYFVGLPQNPFSLMPETELLPDKLRGPGSGGILLGRSVYSGYSISLPPEQFLLHTAVLGKTGVGKTTFLKRLIAQFRRKEIPVLILEPVKREYRDMLADMEDSRIFTVERNVTPLLINPFLVPEGVTLGEYRSSLLSAFKAAFSLPDPLPSLFEKAIAEVYTKYGWSDSSESTDSDVTLFDMADFIRVFKRVIARSSYSGEVKGNMMSGGAFRLQSLIERCPRTFGTFRSTPAEDLLNGCTVLEMGSLEPEQKSLVSALMMIRVLAYLKAARKSDADLRNIILIDEAHALLDQGEGATEEERALNSTMTQLLINVITEIRAYGIGVIFADQSPSRIGSRMLDNVDNVLSFRLSGEEAEMLERHAGGAGRLSEVLPRMAAGEFVMKNWYLASPLAVRTEFSREEAGKEHVSDGEILRKQAGYLLSRGAEQRPFPECGKAGCRRCSETVREAGKKNAVRIFDERQSRMKDPESIAAHILRIPAVLASGAVGGTEKEEFRRLCACTAIQLLRRCDLEKDIHIGRETAGKLLTDMFETTGKETGHE